MAIDDKILNKIKKCLALGQSSEPHEAAAAMRQAQRLMEIHGISQADIGRADIGQAEVKSKVSVSRIRDWELRLLNVISKAFGCKLLWVNSTSYSSDVYGRYILIGIKAQVQLAQYTADVMQRKLMKARSSFVQSLPPGLSRNRKTVEADGFCHGWVQAVGRTVHEFALSDETKKIIDDIREEQASGVAPLRSGQIGAYGAQAGLEAGEGESIHRPMGVNTFTQIGVGS